MNYLESILLCFPFAFVLLSLALMPLLAPKFWHKNEVIVFTITAALSILISFSFMENVSGILTHTIIDDYIPFIITIMTLYMLSHGIHIKVKSSSSTLANVIFLGISSIFASFIGTTGASMLFLRPFIEMNKARRNKSHLIIFFIFLVSNIGGLLSPLGDPPLLLGYIHGVDFLWCFENLFFGWLGYVSACLLVLFAVDKILIKKEKTKLDSSDKKVCINVKGYVNILLIFGTIVILFAEITPEYAKYIILLLFCAISYSYSQKRKLEKIDFSAFNEVARTFLVIFITMAPVTFMLTKNSFVIQEYITNLSRGSDPAGIYFWLCGLASSFLDNAPSYLLFFNIAGGDANELMTSSSNILTAISISSVVMGSMTYIGNAPNMMVRSISEKRGVKMPSFLGYMSWSCLIILPISLFMSWLLAS